MEKKRILAMPLTETLEREVIEIQLDVSWSFYFCGRQEKVNKDVE